MSPWVKIIQYIFIRQLIKAKNCAVARSLKAIEKELLSFKNLEVCVYYIYVWGCAWEREKKIPFELYIEG